MGTGTSFDSISLEDMRTEVRALRIKLFTGASSNRLSMEKMRIMHDAANKPLSFDVSCWFAELVLLCCSVTLSSVLLNVSIVMLVTLRGSKEFMKWSMLPSVVTSAATMTKGTAMALMMVSRLSSIPLCAAGDDLRQAGKQQQQVLFILLNQPGL